MTAWDPEYVPDSIVMPCGVVTVIPYAMVTMETMQNMSVDYFHGNY